MVDASTYHGIGKSKRVSLMELVPQTSPWLAPMNPQQQAAELRSRNVFAPFIRYDESFRDRVQRGTKYDLKSGLGLLLLLGGPVLSFWLAISGYLPFLTKQKAGIAASASALVFFGIGVYLIANESARFFRRQLLPKILYELGPMSVTPAEWEAVAQRMKRLRFPTWRMVKREIPRLGQAAHTAAVSNAAATRGARPALNLNFNR
jgi:hypothetical protein